MQEVFSLLEPIKDMISYEFNSKNEVILKAQDSDMAKISQYLFRNLDCELASVVGTDERDKTGDFGIRYIFSYKKKDVFFILETSVKDTFYSLSNIIPACNWYERELKDMFGLTPLNHPDPRPLMMFPENYPNGFHPLRKDVRWDSFLELKDYGTYQYNEMEGDGVFNILVGPIHAGIIEPGHFRFSLAGEHILELEIRLFWKHRGIEKLAEGKAPEELIKIVQNISGDHTIAHTLAYIQGIEKLSNSIIPLKAKYIRTILAELERLMCNINDVGWLFQDVAYSFGAQGMFVLKEDIMRLNKFISGNRFNKNSITIGGVNIDLSKDTANNILKTLNHIYEKYLFYKDIIFKSSSIIDRYETTGRIKYETAKDLSCVGYTARGSSISSDIRKEHPYLIYDTSDFKSEMFEEGDTLARLKCRLSDIEDSIKILKEVLNNIPEGDIYKKPNPIKKDAWVLGYAEGQRGNIIHFIKTDENGNIDRLKVRDPSFNNWQTIQFAVLGDIIADFPLVNKSLNLSYAGNDL